MKIYCYCISSILLLLAWQMCASFSFIDVAFFPSPFSILKRTYELFAVEHVLQAHVWASMQRYIYGAIIAIPLAFMLALLIELNIYIKVFFKPLIAISFPIPKLALFPILMICFGIGETPKILLIAIGIFYLAVFHFLVGFQKIINSQEYLLLKLYRVSFKTIISQILLKGAAVDILSGVQAGLSYGLVMLVAGEMNATNFGLGHFIWSSWDLFRIQDLYVAFFIIAAWGGVVFAVFEMLLYRLQKARS